MAFLVDDNDSEIPFSADALVPNLGVTNLVFLTGAILMFAGMEVAGFPPTRRATRPAASPGRSCWRP